MARRIGVITMPLGLDDSKEAVITKATVDWLESAGLEVVPIPYTYSPSHARHIVDSNHGLYLQGGPVDNPRYRSLVKALLIEAYTRHKRMLNGEEGGTYFPIWGTCHGLQTVLTLYAMDPALDEFNQEGPHRSVLRLMPHVKTEGRLTRAVRHFPTSAIFSHQYGMSLERFRASDILGRFFRVLTTSHDRGGKRFISTLEGKEMPIYLVQYHPEIDPQLQWMAEFLGVELAGALRVRGPLTPRASELAFGKPRRCPASPYQPLVGADRLCYMFSP
jgi:gamma-glutamyl hydrolase